MILVTVILCGFLYGCKVGYIQSISRMFLSSNPPFDMTSNELSWVASISFSGTFVSVCICYVLGNKVGRRKFLITCATIFTSAWLLILATNSVDVVIFCFFFYGIAASMVATIGNVYFGEIATPRNREVLGISYGLAGAIGTNIEILLSMFECNQLLTLFPFVMSLITLATSVFMVESPCYHLSQNLNDEAAINMCWLNDRTTLHDLHDMFQSMQEYVDEQKEKRLGKMNGAFTRSNLKLISVMLFISAASHVSCIPIIVQYGSLIIHRFRDSINGKVFVGFYSGSMVLAGLISLYTLKIFSRRTMLLCGIFLSALIQQYCSLLFYVEEMYDYNIPYVAIEIAVLLIIHLVVTSTMFGASMVVLKAEIFPHDLKEFYSSLLAFTHDSVSFIVIKSFINLSTKISPHFLFLIFSMFAYASTVVAYFFISDTKGKTLYQIRKDYTNVEIG